MTRGKKNKKASQSCSYELLPSEYLKFRQRNATREILREILISYHSISYDNERLSVGAEKEYYTKLKKAIAEEYTRISRIKN